MKSIRRIIWPHFGVRLIITPPASRPRIGFFEKPGPFNSLHMRVDENNLVAPRMWVAFDFDGWVVKAFVAPPTESPGKWLRVWSRKVGPACVRNRVHVTRLLHGALRRVLADDCATKPLGPGKIRRYVKFHGGAI